MPKCLKASEKAFPCHPSTATPACPPNNQAMKRDALAPKQSPSPENQPPRMDRRSFLGFGAVVAGAAFAPTVSAGDRDWSGKSPVRYPDPDIVVLDPRF